MKKVIFVCLLSISMCVSLPSQQQVAEKQQTPPAASPDTNAVKTTIATPAQAAPEQIPTHTDTAAVPEKATVPATNNATKTQNETLPANDDTKKTEPVTEKTPKENGTKTTEAPKPSPTTTVAPPTEPSTIKPDGKEGKTTAPTTVVVNSTPAPVKPTLQSRAFDGPSFIGGMILTLGLLAIGFMGFKYYKNQTERNYHTL